MQQRVADGAGVSLRDDEYYDEEAQELLSDSKREREIRHGFIRKVYGILSTQLLMTCVFGAVCTANHAARLWIAQNIWLYIVAAVGAIVLLLVLVCVPGLSQKTPTNYILLALFTVFETVSIGCICAQASLSSGGGVVLQAAIATCAITVGLTLFAFQTKYDFTSKIAILFYISIAASIFALFTLFFRNTWITGIICAVFALIMCAHIVIDTQMLLGSGKIRASVDDYVLCSAMLYLDIINLFVYLLRILQLFQRD